MHLDSFPHTTRSQQAGKVAVWVALMQHIGTPTAFSSCMYVKTQHQPAEHWQDPLASLYGVATEALGPAQRLLRCTLPCHGKQGFDLCFVVCKRMLKYPHESLQPSAIHFLHAILQLLVCGTCTMAVNNIRKLPC